MSPVTLTLNSETEGVSLDLDRFALVGLDTDGGLVLYSQADLGWIAFAASVLTQLVQQEAGRALSVAQEVEAPWQ